MIKSVLKIALTAIAIAVALTASVQAAPAIDDGVSRGNADSVDVCRATDWHDITASGIIQVEHPDGCHRFICHCRGTVACEWKNVCIWPGTCWHAEHQVPCCRLEARIPIRWCQETYHC